MLPVYCLTLDPKGKRAARTVEEFRPYGITPTLVRGVDGNKAALKATVELHHNDGYPYFIGPHHIGIILANWMLWNHLLLAKVPEAMIVEDDVKLCDNFIEEFKAGYAELPSDWGWAFVGHCCAQGKPTTQVTHRIWDARWPMCFHCYIVKSSALELMIDPMLEFRAPVDVSIIDNVFMKDLVRAYTFKPRLASQHDIYLPN